ncbi:hypothetical protein, partial [Streptomyces sp. McG7]|nr:hypothetical protein [Streptomyces sp. McG7]
APPATAAPRTVLASGEVRTCLLPAGQALDSRAAAGPAPGRRLTRPPGYPGRMDYVSALLPPVVMAVFFIGVIRVIVKTQGGANKTKEDAAVDAALARADGSPAGKTDA